MEINACVTLGHECAHNMGDNENDHLHSALPLRHERVFQSLPKDY